MSGLPLLNRYALAVTRRQIVVWRKMIGSSVATNIVSPVFYLFAFGLGLGRFVESIDGLDYLAYVVPGMIAYSAMFAASFETTVGAFTRYGVNGNWHAILATPVTLGELLFGEMLFAALKAMLAALCVALVGWLWGGLPNPAGLLWAIPAVFIASVGFACQGLLATALARGYEFFSYFFTFWVTPGFVLSGVFFDIDDFPAPVQAIAWCLPTTHLLAVIRPLTGGQTLEFWPAAGHMLYGFVLTVVCFALAFWRIHRRIFD